MKSIGKVLFALVICFFAIILLRTFMFSPEYIKYDPPPGIPLNSEVLAGHLADAVKIPTVSYENTDSVDYHQFGRLHNFLKTTYPRIFSELDVESVNTHSLLIIWKGKNLELPSMVLMAHQDVVPATDSEWTYPPFEGFIDDSFIWGRGTLDDKSTMIAILEAVSYLIEMGYRPERTIYLVFGHDEEIGGQAGAKKIAELFLERDIRPGMILDEGMAVISNIMPGLDRPVGLIGIAEKGYVTIELTASSDGGHSSMPSKHSAIGMLSEALVSLKNDPPKAGLDGATKLMFEAVGPYMSFSYRLIFANTWLFEPILIRQLEKQASTNALIRTTVALTTIQGGDKENVLPTTASASVNFRIKPGDTIESIIDYVEETLCCTGVDITNVNREFASEPSAVSSVGDDMYNLLASTISVTFPDAVLAPGLVIGGTDSRHFELVSDYIYRFAPLNLNADDLKRIHGVDERISKTDFANMVRFYVRLIKGRVE
ncbi:MAG: M20 family peptidase [Fidelibacterota bacterium]